MKTTLRKLISEIPDKDINYHSPGWSDLSCALEIFPSLEYSDNERLKCYYLARWFCTDSCVGTRAYFLDEEFVAITKQLGRKYNEEFEFISNSAANKVRNYILKLLEEQTPKPVVNLITWMDEAIDDTFTIEYASEILHKTALLWGERVEVIHTPRPTPSCAGRDWVKDGFADYHSIEVKKQDGTVEKVDCRQLKFEYNS